MGRPTAGFGFGLLYLMHVSQLLTMFFRIPMHSSSRLPAESISLFSFSTEACPNCLCSFSRVFCFSCVVIFPVTVRISSSS